MSFEKEINRLRGKISKEEFEAFRRLSSAEQCEKLATGAPDEETRNLYLADAARLRETEVAKQAEKEVTEVRNQEFLRLRALAKGPTLWQRVLWKLEAVVKACGLLVVPASKWLFDISIAIYALTFITGSIGAVAFNSRYGLEVNAILSFAFLISSGAIFVILWGVLSSKEAKCTALLMATLTCALLAHNWFGYCFKADSLYVGIMENSDGVRKIINCADRSTSMMESPGFNSKITWYRVMERQNDPSMTGLQRYSYRKWWKADVGMDGMSGIAWLSLDRLPIIENFLEIHEEGRGMGPYMQDLDEQVQKFLDEAVSNREILGDNKKFLEKALKIKNKIFKLENASLSVTFEPIKIETK